METSVYREIKALDKMTSGELKRKYLEVFGERARSNHKDFMRKKIAWRIQALAEGGLSERARRRALEIANDADLRVRLPRVKQLLPLKPLDLEAMAVSENVEHVDLGGASERIYDYEPGPAVLMNTIVPRFTELQVYQSVLEAKASEHSARMVAMNNATDNAAELIDFLILERNKARQASITSEILDIVGGAEALAS